MEERKAPTFRPELNKNNPMHVKKAFCTINSDSWQNTLEDYREKVSFAAVKLPLE